MLNITIEGQENHVDQVVKDLQTDSHFHLCDCSQMVKPNSDEKKVTCYVYPKRIKRPISHVNLIAVNGETVSFELSSCCELELEKGKTIIFGWNYDIFSS